MLWGIQRKNKMFKRGDQGRLHSKVDEVGIQLPLKGYLNIPGKKRAEGTVEAWESTGNPETRSAVI